MTANDEADRLRKFASAMLRAALELNPPLKAQVDLAYADLKVVLDEHGHAGHLACHLLANDAPMSSLQLKDR